MKKIMKKNTDNGKPSFANSTSPRLRATGASGGGRITGNGLSQWLFKWPAKFALISFGLLAASLALVVLSAFTKSPELVEIVMYASLAASFVLSVRWAIKKSGDALFSRRDLLSVTLSFAIITSLITALALLAVLLVSMNTIVAYQYMLMAVSPFLYLLCAALGVLFGLYVFGLIVFKFIAIYKYAKANGAPKWKILLSIPAGIAFLGWPAFIAESAKKTEPAISNRARWLDRLIDFVTSKPMYGAAALVIIAVLDGFTDMAATAGTLVAFITLFVFVKVYGLKKLTAQMPGLFSTAAVVLNIAGIIAMLALGYAKTEPHTITLEDLAGQFEQVEIVDND